MAAVACFSHGPDQREGQVVLFFFGQFRNDLVEASANVVDGLRLVG